MIDEVGELTEKVEELARRVSALGASASGGARNDLLAQTLAALARAESAMPTIESAPPNAPPPAPIAPTAVAPPLPKYRDPVGGVLDDRRVVSFLERWKAERFADCPFEELYRFARAEVPGLTVGRFQDELRRLYDERTILLSIWSGPIDRIPHPELAFFVASTVMYYARPA
jgi:hypothetical protein